MAYDAVSEAPEGLELNSQGAGREAQRAERIEDGDRSGPVSVDRWAAVDAAAQEGAKSSTSRVGRTVLDCAGRLVCCESPDRVENDAAARGRATGSARYCGYIRNTGVRDGRTRNWSNLIKE